MTKDEAIDREAEWKLFKAQMMLDYGSHVFKRDALGESDNMAWQDAFGGWLAAKRSIAQAPTSEAVAEKLANEYVSGTVVSDFDGPKVTLRYRTTAAAEAAFEALTDAIDRQIAAQPAADPAPVPANVSISPPKMNTLPESVDGVNTFDHAKLAEGERAAFEAWALSDDGNCSRADLMKWSPKDRQAQEGETYCCDLVERDWRVWQARGQQAGVPEVQKTEVV